MKIRISFIAAAVAFFLTAAHYANADTPAKAKKQTVKKTAQVATVDYNTVVIRDSRPKTEQYGAEIGSDAPHQERNPSAHPELFQISR